MGVDDQDIIEFVGATICAGAIAKKNPAFGADWKFLVDAGSSVAALYVESECVRTPEIDDIMEQVSLHLSTPEGRMN